MNNTTKLLLACLVLVVAWIGVQQLNRPAPVAPVDDADCVAPGGG